MIESISVCAADEVVNVNTVAVGERTGDLTAAHPEAVKIGEQIVGTDYDSFSVET